MALLLAVVLLWLHQASASEAVQYRQDVSRKSENGYEARSSEEGTDPAA
jgi:hypothetical protein